MKKCKYCNKEIPDDAKVCKHCGNDLVPQKSTRFNRKRRGRIIAFAGLGFVVLFFIGASILDNPTASKKLKGFVSDVFTKKDKGELVGISYNIEFSKLTPGSVDEEDMEFAGTITLEKANGEQIKALCEPSLAKTLKGGQIIEVVFDKELDSWKATRVVGDSK